MAELSGPQPLREGQDRAQPLGDEIRDLRVGVPAGRDGDHMHIEPLAEAVLVLEKLRHVKIETQRGELAGEDASREVRRALP
jgi:hypothetical protein